MISFPHQLSLKDATGKFRGIKENASKKLTELKLRKFLWIETVETGGKGLKSHTLLGTSVDHF